MGKYILGISAFYHDSAAAIIKDDKIIAAAQEERFTRKKHDPRFPVNAINYCLEEAFIEPDEIDLVVFYDNPLVTLDRIIKNHITTGEKGADVFDKASNSMLGIKLWIEDKVKEAIGCLGKEGKVVFTGHHASHAASAFFPSGFEKAAIMTLDGVGEWATSTFGVGEGNKITINQEINYPHSLGLLYSAFTYYTGFKVNSGEYKLMGLAPYGKPIYADKIKEHLIDIKEDGSYRLDMSYFAFMDSMETTSEKFHELFGGAPRVPESDITRKEMDLAASVQAVTEEVVLKMARNLRKTTGCENLVMAGGVALNCVSNGKIYEEKIFENIWIQPAAGDAGGALGAALVGAHMYYDLPRTASGEDTQSGSYLGPEFKPNEVAAYLDRNSIPATRIEDNTERNKVLAGHLANAKVLGFFNGRMEFGPRSLGGRSIIGDSRSQDMQKTMNLKIKYRESFRPFAPAVLDSDVAEYFEYTHTSPYMLMVAPVKKERCIEFEQSGDDMISMINESRSDIPAVTHVDHSARIQTIHENTNPNFHGLISAFKAETGCSVLVNTSFNVRGEPIVCTPKDAYTCFMRTEMDVLVLGEYVLLKEEQPKFEDGLDWQNEFELD